MHVWVMAAIRMRATSSFGKGRSAPPRRRCGRRVRPCKRAVVRGSMKYGDGRGECMVARSVGNGIGAPPCDEGTGGARVAAESSIAIRREPSTMHAMLFDGVARMHGRSRLARLEQSVVAVIGLGGVGSWCAEALARSGVGALVLADLDEVCVSNTNRQIHAVKSTYGRPKCEVMAERLRQINPDIRLHLVSDFITDSNIEGFIEECASFGLDVSGGGVDFVIDCVDQERHKAAIIAKCVELNVPILTTGGCGGLSDPSGIECDDLNLSNGDNLLSKVRIRLRQEYGFGDEPSAESSDENNDGGAGRRLPWNVTAVFSPRNGGSVGGKHRRARRGSMACGNGAGSSVMVTGSFGLFAASECVAQILAKSEKEETRRRSLDIIDRVFDSHCHVVAQGGGTDGRGAAYEAAPMAWQALRNVGIMATGPDDWELCTSIWKTHNFNAAVSGTLEHVHVGFGLHPYEVDSYVQRHESEEHGNHGTSTSEGHGDSVSSALYAQLNSCLEDCPDAVVGEFGLDKSILKKLKRQQRRDREVLTNMWDRQVRCFETQMRLACDQGRPVVLHMVHAYGFFERYLMKLCAEAQLPKKILLHSYSGSAQLVRRLSGLCEANDVELYFGFSYSVNVRPSAKGGVYSERVFDVIDAVPDNRLLIESDGHLGKEAENASVRENLIDIIHVVSSVKEWDIEHTIKTTAQNGERFYAVGRKGNVKFPV